MKERIHHMAKILLAEDDSSMRLFLSTALKKAGHSVEAYPDGLSAFDRIRKDCDFDLLLTDIVMPGMDGIELAQKTTEACPNVQVMFITGFAAVAIGIQNKTVQSNAKVLSKPFHLKELVNQVDLLLAA